MLLQDKDGSVFFFKKKKGFQSFLSFFFKKKKEEKKKKRNQNFEGEWKRRKPWKWPFQRKPFAL
jgi:hypothetical protein